MTTYIDATTKDAQYTAVTLNGEPVERVVTAHDNDGAPDGFVQYVPPRDADGALIIPDGAYLVALPALREYTAVQVRGGKCYQIETSQEMIVQRSGVVAITDTRTGQPFVAVCSEESDEEAAEHWARLARTDPAVLLDRVALKDDREARREITRRLGQSVGST